MNLKDIEFFLFSWIWFFWFSST